MSNLMAVLLQTLAARLGVVTGHDLAQACRAEYSRGVNAVLWVLAEVAIAATRPGRDPGDDHRAEAALRPAAVCGAAWSTAFDTFLLLYLQRWGMRQVEAVILALVATIGGVLPDPDLPGPAGRGGGRLGAAAEPCRRGRCTWRSASWAPR